MGARPADRRHQQAFHPLPRVVHLLLCKPGIDHVHNPVDRQRGLGDVRRDDNLPPRRSVWIRPLRRRIEDPLLLLRRQTRVQRVHLDGPHLLAQLLNLPGNLPARVFYLLLARQKQQHVTLRLVRVDLYHRPDRRLQVVPLRLLRVENLHGMQPSRHFNQRRIQEVILELLGLQRRRHDHHFQVWPLEDDLLQEPKQDVRRQRPLVRLVQNHHAILAQRRIRHRLPQQHTVRRKLHLGLGPTAVLETNRVPHLLPKTHVHLVRHAPRHRHRRNTARLRAHDLKVVLAVASLGDELGNLRRLSGTRLSDQNQVLMLGQHRDDVLPRLPHGKPCRRGAGWGGRECGRGWRVFFGARE